MVSRRRVALAVPLVLLLLAALAWVATGGGDAIRSSGEPAGDHVGGTAADRNDGPLSAPAATPDAVWIARNGAGTITGRVVSGVPGRPFAARVTLTRSSAAAGTAPLAADTDAAGQFRIEGVPANVSLRVVASAAGCADAVLDGVRVVRDAEHDVGDLVIGTPRTLRLSLVDDESRPVAAQVEIHAVKAASFGRGRTAAESAPIVSRRAPAGTCEIDGLPCRSMLIVRAEGFLPIARWLELRESASREETLRLRRGAPFGGRVVTSSGAAVPGVRVRVAHSPSRGAEATTDGDGRFRLAAVPAGVAEFVCVLDECCCVPIGAARVPDADGATFRLPPLGTLAGQVVDAATGARIGGAEIVRGSDGTSAGTDAEGRFLLRRVPAGTAELSCRADGYAPVVWGEGDADCPSVAADATTTLRISMSRGAVVAGKVRGLGGEPVAGALLEVQTWRASRGLDVTATARTGAEGGFRAVGVPAGPALIRVVAQGLAMDGYPADPWGAFDEGRFPAGWAVMVPASGVVERDFTLRRGATVAGVVVDAEGAPLASVVVTAGALWGEGAEALTGADGAFRIDAVPPVGECVVRCRTPDERAAELPAFPVASGAAVQGLRLVAKESLVTVRGTVALRSGGPLPADTRVRIDAGDREHDARTSATVAVAPDGSFEGAILCLSGAVRVTATARGFRARVWEPEFDSLGDTSHVAGLLLDSEREVAGVVVDEAGAPVAGASISRQEARPYRRPVSVLIGVTDSLGRFTLRGQFDDEERLTVTGPGWCDATAVVAPGDEPLRVVLTASRSLSGRVTSEESGAPLEGVVVHVMSGDSDVDPRTAVTGADGRWRVDGLAPEKYRVRAAPLFTPSRHNVIEASRHGVATGASDVDFALRAGLVIAGRFVLEDGRPYVDAMELIVTAETATDRSSIVAVRDDGTFEIRGVPRGKVKLVPSAYVQELVLDGSAEVEAGRTDVVFVLRRAARIIARFVDEDGEPVEAGGEGSWVVLTEVARPREHTWWEPGPAAGEIRWPQLHPHREYLLDVDLLGGFVAQRITGLRTGAADTPVEITVRLVRGGRITGRVVDADGNGLRAHSVIAVAVGDDEPAGPGCGVSALSAADGSFALEGLGPHRFRLRVVGPSGGDPIGPEPAPVHGDGDDVVLRVTKPR